jgi:hypothetical protein
MLIAFVRYKMRRDSSAIFPMALGVGRRDARINLCRQRASGCRPLNA